MEQVIVDPRSGATTLTGTGLESRRELANFLKRRRESIHPETHGLAKTVRRRVAGLRREEVAELAGISVAWYTWVEQARELNLSVATLNGIAKALRLDTDEVAHLFELAGQPVPAPESRADERAMLSLWTMLKALDPNPAYALDSHWQIVAWNDATKILFGDLAMAAEKDRNYIRLIFTSDRLRSMFLNWEEVARCSLAHFRSDSARNVDDRHWQTLVAELTERSATFRDWWAQHNVAWPHSWRKELHTAEGLRVYNTFDLALLRPLRLRVVTYIEDKS